MKIVECGNIREFQLCLCKRERLEAAIFETLYTFYCWNGKNEKTDYCNTQSYRIKGGGGSGRPPPPPIIFEP